jgi:membrane-bound ClpP family serine protease
VLGSNTAFCLVIFGVLAIYCEFIWPGRVLPSVCGSAAAVTGGYFLWRASPSALGIELLALATALFVIDAVANTRFLAGTAATATLTLGFLRLLSNPHNIRPVLAMPWCIVFGAITMALNWAARRGRHNKRLLH